MYICIQYLIAFGYPPPCLGMLVHWSICLIGWLVDGLMGSFAKMNRKSIKKYLKLIQKSSTNQLKINQNRRKSAPRGLLEGSWEGLGGSGELCWEALEGSGGHLGSRSQKDVKKSVRGPPWGGVGACRSILEAS